jgi:DNA-binding SARP family transcriptional activator
MGTAIATRTGDEPNLHEPVASPTKERPDHTSINLQLLGGFRLTVDGRATQLPESAQRLVAFLALRRRPQTRLCVAGNLWPDKNDERATANLRSTIWRSRLDDGHSFVDTNGSMIGLDPSTSLDVLAVESLRPDETTAALVSNHTLSLGELFDELLPGWYDDWVLIERDRIAHIQLKIAESLARALIARGDAIAATDLAYRSVALDPMGDVKQRILSWIE